MVTQIQNLPWSNWSGHHFFTVGRTYFPTNLLEIVESIRQCESLGSKLHAYGSGWSFSSAPHNPPAMMSTNALRRVLMLQADSGRVSMGTSILAPSALQGRYGLALMEAGCKVSGIYNVLTAMGSALPTFGGSAGQSLAGVLGTASHGGDLDRKPLADWVHGLLLVGEGGRVSWIERETGGPYIDEPKLRAASYSASDIDIFRDDDMLNAAVAACGRMGVIYAMLLELVGTYNLHESRTWLPWPMVRDTASRGFPSLVNMMQYDNRQLHFLQILLSLDRDFPTCSVTRRNETRDNNWIPRPADPDLSWDLLFHHSDWIGILGGPQSELGSRLNGVSDADIRAIMAYVYANFLAPRQVQGPYWYVMDAGAGELRVQASEYAFDANDTTYLNFIDDVLLLARSPQIPGLLALRYCPRSDALLAVSKYETTVHVEIAVPRGYNGNASFYERVQEQALARRGIPHLGQHNELNANQMRAAFGNDLHTWRKALTRTCERAQRGTFSNSFSRERGLEPLGHDNLLLFG